MRILLSFPKEVNWFLAASNAWSVFFSCHCGAAARLPFRSIKGNKTF